MTNSDLFIHTAGSTLENDGRSLLQRIVDFVFGYDYFISYAWRDGNKYALQLAQQLSSEGFEVFLDRANYASGDDWKKVGAWTLRRTGMLVLVGSPAALVSVPVAREVELFSESGRRIAPIDFGGSLRAIPPSIGLAAYLPTEIIRIEESADALAQGPSSDTLATLRRSFNITRQDKKRLRVALTISITLFLLALIAFAFGLYAQMQRARAEATLAAATKSSNQFVIDIAMKLRNAGGLPLDDVSALLNDAGGMLEALHAVNADDSALMRSRAMFLRETSQTLLAKGDAAGALDKARQSHNLLDRLNAATSTDPALQHELALSYNRLGDAYHKLDLRLDALDNYRQALAIREKSSDQTPDGREDLARSLERTADELFDADPNAAAALYDRDFQIRKELATKFPERADRQEALAVSYERRARVARTRGEDPLPPYLDARILRETLAARDPTNAVFQASLGNTYDAIGEILSTRGQLGDAREALRTARDIRRTLVARARDNVDWQARLAKTLARLASCGDEPAKNYREAKDILANLDRVGRLPDGLRDLYVEVAEKTNRSEALRSKPKPQ